MTQHGAAPALGGDRIQIKYTLTSKVSHSSRGPRFAGREKGLSDTCPRPAPSIVDTWPPAQGGVVEGEGPKKMKRRNWRPRQPLARLKEGHEYRLHTKNALSAFVPSFHLRLPSFGERTLMVGVLPWVIFSGDWDSTGTNGRFVVVVAYVGLPFRGFQSQDDRKICTVQDVLEEVYLCRMPRKNSCFVTPFLF